MGVLVGARVDVALGIAVAVAVGGRVVVAVGAVEGVGAGAVGMRLEAQALNSSRLVSKKSSMCFIMDTFHYMGKELVDNPRH